MLRTGLAALAAAFVGALVLSTEVQATFATRHTIAPASPSVYRHAAYVQLAGTGADCSAYAVRAYELMRAHGVPVRFVIAAADANLYDTHAFVEAQQPNGRWVVEDPTFDGWWSIDGNAASAADLQSALASGRLSAVRWHGPAAPITSYYVDPLLLFRTVEYGVVEGQGAPTIVDSRTVKMPSMYYATSAARDSIAQVVVVHGGSGWRLGPYDMMSEPGNEWVSPIAFVHDLPLEGLGAGTVTTLSVPRFPASQVAHS